MQQSPEIHYVENSGEIGYQYRDEPRAPDHFPLYCKIKKNRIFHSPSLET